MAEIPEEPGNYSPEEIADGMGKLIMAFQLAFDRHIRSKLFPVAVRKSDEGMEFSLVSSAEAAALSQVPESESDRCGIRLLVDPRGIQTWSEQKGALESACRAARELSGHYDVGIGIAKKGMWLSFIFSQLGLTTYDLMVLRNGDGRITFPMDPVYRKTLAGKRIILFDNDSVTGKTISAVAEGMVAKAPPRFVDVLLISRFSHISDELYEQVKDELAPGQPLGKDKGGKRVIDTFSGLPSGVLRKRMALESDFPGMPRDLNRLRMKLGVGHG